MPGSREAINDTLKKETPPRQPSIQQETIQIRGILRALHLDKDWLEVHTTGENPESIKIHDAGDVIDDLVGPMVNRPIIVDAVKGRGGRLNFRDIQSDE
jgi:hypothetical protein